MRASRQLARTPRALPPSKKFDRQLRVWGAEGQAALEAARVCVLGSGAVAAEALKNLVLGGVAGFTVVDDARVTEEDTGNNFMLSASDIGRPRAAAVADAAAALGDGVRAAFVDAPPAAHALADAPLLATASLVIAADLAWDDAAAVDAACRAAGGAPLVVARAAGLAGALRVCVAEHAVVDARPADAPRDLRLASPWPELAAAAAGVDLAAMDGHGRAHVPAALLAVRAVDAAAARLGRRPTYADRAVVADALAELKAGGGGGGEGGGREADAPNFDEAAALARLALAPPSLPRAVADAVLNDPRADAPSADDADFWFLAAGLKRFVAAHGGAPPLDGDLPDMHASTDAYVSLTRLYRARADADAAEVGAGVGDALEAAGRARGAVGEGAVKLFAKNARHLRVVRARPLADALATVGAVLRDALTGDCEPGGGCAAAAALALMIGADAAARARGGAPPGAADDADAADLESDVAALKAATAAALADAGGGAGAAAGLPDDAVVDAVRAGGGTLHVVAAIVGGLAAQEGIKLVTRTHVPVAGTVVYDGAAQTVTVVEGV